MSEPLNSVQLRNIRARLEDQDPNRMSYFLLSWLRMTPEDYMEVNAIERPFVKGNIGDWRHLELSWRPHPGPGPVSFGAWAGRWPEQPKNTGWLKRTLYEAKKYFFTPPEGTRGTYIAGHSFSRELYEHRAYYVTAADELKLWNTCCELHGAGFNTVGYYRTSFWPRATTYDKFFCSEAVLAALQLSGVLHSILPQEGDDTVLHMNPGRATPSMLYSMLSQYGEETANPYHIVDHDSLQGPSRGFQFIDDSQDE